MRRQDRLDMLLGRNLRKQIEVVGCFAMRTEDYGTHKKYLGDTTGRDLHNGLHDSQGETLDELLSCMVEDFDD